MDERNHRGPGTSATLALVALIAGCASSPALSDRPAVLERATPEVRAELAAVLERALGARDLLLADDALTETSVLTLENALPANSPARGRDTGLPERFDLVLRGNRCELVHARTGESYRLDSADCLPAPQDREP